jgi:hypothetical protein
MMQRAEKEVKAKAAPPRAKHEKVNRAARAKRQVTANHGKKK